MSGTIAEALVRVRPDMVGFSEEVKAGTERASAEGVKVPVRGDTKNLDSDLNNAVSSGGRTSLKVPVEAKVAEDGSILGSGFGSKVAKEAEGAGKKAGGSFGSGITGMLSSLC